ncbi:MAG: hypothetical protein HC831_03845 [Chloroflexia bacterium]|nr:hypothetical protein [Chloroflexia bacterium]
MKNVILLLTLLSLNLTVRGTDTDSLAIEKLKMRVEKLEEFKDVRDEKFDDQIELLKEKNSINLDRAKQELRDEIRPFIWAAGALGILAAFALLGFVYQFFIGVRKEAEKQLKKNLQNHLKENSEVLLSLIGSQKHDERLKSDAKIVTLSASEESASTIEKTLNKMGFKNVDSKTIDKYVKLEHADLVVFNNSAKDLNEDVIFEYLRQSPEGVLFVCFYPEYMRVPKELTDKVNFANKPFTLYHQIMQTLTFQRLNSNT